MDSDTHINNEIDPVDFDLKEKARESQNGNVELDLQRFQEIADQIGTNKPKLSEHGLQLLSDYLTMKNRFQDCDLPEKQLTQHFEYIFQCFREDGRDEYGLVWKMLDEACKMVIVHHNYCNAQIVCTKILKIIRPFHIQRTLDLFQGSQDATENMLQRQDIALLLGMVFFFFIALTQSLNTFIVCVGYTGAGKSTTTHFICGSQFKAEGSHFRPVAVTNPHLKAVKTDWKVSKSVTTALTAIPFNLKDAGIEEYGDDAKTDIILLDAPGLNDSNGPETDVANSRSIVCAIRQAKSLRILLTIDWGTFTSARMDGVKKLAYTLAHIIPSFKSHRSCIGFIITKIPKKERSTSVVKKFISQALAENDDDQTFIDFLKIMKKSELILLNPIESDRDQVLSEAFEDKEWIRFPGPHQIVRSFAPDSALDKIKEQSAVVKNRVVRRMNRYQKGHKLDFDLLEIMLNELKGLRACLSDVSLIEDNVNEISKIIKNGMDDKIEACVQKLIHSTQSHDANEFTENVVEYKLLLTDVDIMSEFKNKHFANDIGISPSLLTETLDNVFQQALQKCTMLPESAIYFDKTAIFVQHFPHFEQDRNTKLDEIVTQLDELYFSTMQSLHENDVKSVWNSIKTLGTVTHLAGKFDTSHKMVHLREELLAGLTALKNVIDFRNEKKRFGCHISCVSYIMSLSTTIFDCSRWHGC